MNEWRRTEEGARTVQADTGGLWAEQRAVGWLTDKLGALVPVAIVPCYVTEPIVARRLLELGLRYRLRKIGLAANCVIWPVPLCIVSLSQ